MKAMKQAVLNTAKQLAKANNTVTTLEIKTEVRRDYPYFYWTQDIVSQYMMEFAENALFNYTDNGTFRTYSLPITKTFSRRHSQRRVHKSMGATSVGLSGVVGTTGVVGVVTNNKGKIPTVKVPAANKLPKSKKIDRTNVITLAHNPSFESVTFQVKGDNYRIISAKEIRAQKKSPWGYITPKVSRVSKITVGGNTYKVK